MKTIDFSKDPAGGITVIVNGQAKKAIINPNNVVVKPLAGGAIIKLSDETWRQEVSLTDTVTEDSVAKSPFADVDALTTYLISLF